MTVASFTPETLPSLQTAFNLQHHQLLLISQLRNLLLNTTTCFTDTGEQQQAYALHALSEGTVKVRSISSRLWVNIENSRRFKALPLTVGLLSLGKDGYRDFITRNILFARRAAECIFQSPIIPAASLVFQHRFWRFPCFTSFMFEKIGCEVPKDEGSVWSDY
ncbi:hypothetical protein C350_04244 [Cryptococcus neoformans MW-RSA36]|nr:hypothetical protein C350_04244 [Cryptococcus neoformans var. grubii MW-RSA36]